MTNRERVVALWAVGNKAPYDLFETSRIRDGAKILVEAVGGRETALIELGEVISQEIANRVQAQMFPPIGPAQAVEVPVRDAQGNIVADTDGSPKLEMKLITPEPEIDELSDHSKFEDLAHQDICCDQCGEPRTDLFRLGTGWYCKAKRVPEGATEETTCYDIRLTQLGIAS